ncbi:MAG: nicotinate (nicotinamide) nucleotide adenylyltransferase [Proteobacteria bacterium]|nr:nicotinate (nicotinamide) nucleotide adenylyltransferase [Pseudomonadota bacterium]NCA28526.1 nicotinate (nicotinamide) nucleotide adenylyltransferase [Pseudomonadota bacterium]
MIKIGILGGSFNPAHEGHVHISKLAIQKLSLKQLWWVPTAQHPFKKFNNFLDLEERIKLCQKITKLHPKIKVKKIDNFYAIDLIKKLQKQHKFVEFIWVMGADNLPNFHKWHKFQELINCVQFAIFTRQDFILKNANCPALKMAKKYHRNSEKFPKISLFHSPNLDISSTKIRNSHV